VCVCVCARARARVCVRVCGRAGGGWGGGWGGGVLVVASTTAFSEQGQELSCVLAVCIERDCVHTELTIPTHLLCNIKHLIRQKQEFNRECELVCVCVCVRACVCVCVCVSE
jgi:hypothetical protein